jgi:hypothetical protein
MTPNFPAINLAFDKTEEYFKSYRITSHLLKFSGEPNLKHLTSHYEGTVSFFGAMESEINQSIYGSNQNIQVAMFEYLKELLTFWGFGENYKDKIENIVDNYNQTNEQKVDKIYLPKYYELTDNIIHGFTSIANKYISRYEAGLITSNSVVIIQDRPSIKTKLIEQPAKVTEPKKIKVNLTVPQLAYLFKKLCDLKIIEVSQNKEIHIFISENFQPITKNDLRDNISTGKLAKIWSNFDIKDIQFWVSKFIDLHNEAKKDNPNRIK